MRRSRKRDQRKEGGGSSKYPKGSFDRFNPKDGAQWVRLPLNDYTYEVYSREDGEVIEVTDPYYELTTHYIPRLNTVLNCSQGPRKLEPCYPHAILETYYEEKRQTEEETGVKANYDDKPCSASRAFALPVVGVDTYYAVPALDKNGSPRFKRDGAPITNWTPRSVARLPSGEAEALVSKYGHNMHWSLGIQLRDQLMLLDDSLRGVCALCGEDMFAQKFTCTSESCDSMSEYEDLLEKTDVDELTDEENGIHCDKCSHPLEPVWECACGTPTLGSIFDFELRLRAKKVADNSTDLSLLEYRLPTPSVEVDALLAEPLDIRALYAPTPLDDQRRRMASMIKGVDPMLGTFEPR